MSSLPLHPLVVHLPMALAVLVPLLAVGVLIAWRKSWLPARTWWLVAALQLVLVGAAVTSLTTGEREEERVERVVAESAIEAHQDAAQAFTGAAVAVLLLALGGAAARKDGTRQALAGAAAVGSLVVTGLGINTGHKGGELVYRHGAGSAYAPAGASGAAPAAVRAGHRGDDDDDD
jgi:uncharacterized membrane protein